MRTVKKDPHHNHYLMREGKELQEMLKRHTEQQKMLDKMSPNQRKAWKSKQAKKLTVKLVRMGLSEDGQQLIKFVPKKRSKTKKRVRIG